MITDDTDVNLSNVKLPAISVYILKGAAAFTTGWLAFAVVFAIIDRYSATDEMALNSWGDFVAGVSAPIAFIWLVVAVALQSIELREQRKELALTRSEFKSSRLVMKAQADEAKRQAEFIKQQTDLLVSEKADRDAHSVFDASIDLISTRLRQYQSAWHMFVTTSHDENGSAYGVDMTLRNGKFSSIEDEFIIPKTVQALRTDLRNFKENYPENVVRVKYLHDFNRLYMGVVTGTNRISQLPESFRIRAETLELNELNTQLVYIADRAGVRPFDSV